MRLQNKASQQEKDAATASTNLSNTISNNMNTSFQNSQNIQGGLNAQLQRITQQGMAGQGFTGGQEANLRSSSDENAAQANVQAEAARNQQNAGGEQGGAATSGAVASGDEATTNAMAAQNAASQRGITNQNTALAQANMREGLTGLSGLSGQETGQADSLTGNSVGASGQSFGEETQANQPSTFWSGLANTALQGGIGAITGNPMGALAGVKSLFNGGSNAGTGGEGGGFS